MYFYPYRYNINFALNQAFHLICLAFYRFGIDVIDLRLNALMAIKLNLRF